MIKQITELFIKYNIIEEEEYDLYFYGIQLLFYKIVTFVIAVICSGFIGTTFFLFFTLAFYIPLRKYGGGIHASSPAKCIVLSEIILIICQVIYKLQLCNIYFYHCIVLLGMIVVCKFSPLDNKKKRLTHLQKLKYRHCAQMICGIFGVLYVAGIFVSCEILLTAISMAFGIEGCLLISFKFVSEYKDEKIYGR